MSDPHLHTLRDVEHAYTSESAIVCLPHNEFIALKQLRPYKDSRFNQLTFEARLNCQLEALWWNALFSKGIYYGLARLCEEHTSKKIPPECVCIISPTLEYSVAKNLKPDYEYVLVMKRLPDAWRLDNLLSESKTDPERQQDIIRNLTDRISQLFLTVLKPLSQEESVRWGTIKQLRRKLTENLSLLKAALLEEQMSREPYDHFKSQLRKILKSKRFTDNFQKRLEAGFIRRCHGDLKAPNIWITPPEERVDQDTSEYIWLLDAIDFNPSYCNIDVLSDLALLIVDIQARTESEDLANKMIDHYLLLTKQEASAKAEHKNAVARSVLAYYLVEKAIISAAVSIKFDKNRDLGEVYLRVAMSRLSELQIVAI